MNRPKRYDHTYYRGTSDLFTATWKPGGVVANLTGYTVSMHVKDQAGTVLASTDAGEGITATIADPTNGEISFTISDSVGRAMATGLHQYDVWAISGGGSDYPLLKGSFTVVEEVRNV